MSDTIAKDATPHPRNGTSPRQSASDSQSSHSQHASNLNNNSDDSDDNGIEKISRPHSRQSNGSSSKRHESGFRPSIFGHGLSSNSNSEKNRQHGNKSRDIDSDLSDDDEEDDDDDDDDIIDGVGQRGRDSRNRRRRRRRRVAASASHLLAQAPPLPDLRFDHNYRKALDQIHEVHAVETAHVAELNAIAAANSSSLSTTKRKQQKVITVPSLTARITVMTLRDIIIMPFIHGFFWGFGTILLTLATQRTLFAHIQRTWKRIFGGDVNDVPIVTRGSPARNRVSGSGSNRGLGGVGLMNAGSGMSQSGFGRPAGRIY
ncbi:hypothetical protein BGZ46_006255 [Entomortierella lignicola]|nr:hypothetical protein BGZ46_006255 [Entomortierella lignicola]